MTSTNFNSSQQYCDFTSQREITRITSDCKDNFVVQVYQSDGYTSIVVNIINGTSKNLNIEIFDDTQIKSEHNIRVFYDFIRQHNYTVIGKHKNLTFRMLN